MKKAVILVNVGTPDAPKKRAVGKYLREFLGDGRVIDFPWLPRKLLVNGIIVPFRVKNSTKMYQKLWTENGSPLLFYLNRVVEKLQKTVNENTIVFGAMRYQTPSINAVLVKIRKENYESVTVIPLFPQYASSTSGTVNAFVLNQVRKWTAVPELKFVSQFYRNELFLDAFAERIKSYQPEKYDHIIFSYHGLPLRHLDKVHGKTKCADCNCDLGLPECGSLCYKATCYETTHLLAQRLNLTKDEYTTSFQSRLSKNWLSPFTDETIVKLAQKGKKKILVTSPAFVADCLETVIEIGDEYALLFKENGGEQLTLVESLNDSDRWIECLKELIG